MIDSLSQHSPRRVPTARSAADPLVDYDLQLALYLCYELHYRSFAGVSDDREWDPTLLGFRAELEAQFFTRLIEDTGPTRRSTARALETELAETTESFGGLSLSTYIEHAGR